MHAWEQIQMTIDYIETHLGEEIHIEDLAQMAALSPFYYQRLFSRLVKKPVAEYIKLRRLGKATESLLDKDKRILDIALELGFASHEHFTRTFKETFGMTPDEYRKNPVLLSRMTKPELLLHYTLIDEGVPLITEGIVLEINRKQLDEPISFVGYKKDVSFAFMQGLGVESGVDPLDILWTTFHEQKEASFNLKEDSEELGVAYPCQKEGYFSYFGGGLANSAKEKNNSENNAAADLEKITWELPAGEYIVCSFEAEDFKALVMDALYKAEQYAYNVWLPNHKLKTDVFCAERYASHSPETKSMEVWMKVIK